MAAGILFVTISNLFGIIPAKLIRYALDNTESQIGWYSITRDFLSGRLSFHPFHLIS
jgi:hypothetical protein